MSSPANAGRRQPLAAVLLVISLGANLLAMCLPFIVVDKAGSSPRAYGLLGSVSLLCDKHMYALAVLAVGFSILFPFAKLSVIAWAWWRGPASPGPDVWLPRVERVGKWSFFDVFLVVILVALTSDQWLISSSSLPGFTSFLIAIVASMLAGELLLASSRPQRPVMRPALGLGQCLLVVGIGGLLVATLWMPLIKIDDWLLSNHEYALINMPSTLWRNESSMLAFTLGTFVIAVPVLGWLLALVTAIVWWRRPLPDRLLNLQEIVGRWSMLDVFALSLAVFLVESGQFLDTIPRTGAWILAGGLGLYVAGQWLVIHLQRRAQDSCARR